jgi:hypothetical protein
MKNYTAVFTIISLLLSLVTPAAFAAKIGEDSLIVGKSGSAADKKIQLGTSSQGIIKYNASSSKLQFANDGSSFKDFGSGSGAGAGTNLLNGLNNDFEAGTGNWTAAGGTLTATSSGQANGSFSGQWVASAGAQTLKSATSAAVPNAFKGKSGLAKITYKTSASDFVMAVYDNTNTLVKSQTLSASPSSGADYTDAALSWGLVPGTSYYLQITSGSAQTIVLDDAYLGDYALIQFSQASFVGSVLWPAAASCDWTSTSTSYATNTANSSCTFPSGSGIKGTAAAPATKIPAITFASLPPGKYVVKAIGGLANAGSPNNVCTFNFSDGTSMGDTDGTVFSAGALNVVPTTETTFEYTTTKTNVTFELQSRAISSATCKVRTSETSLGIVVYRFPTSTTTITTIDQNVAQSWSGSHGNDCSWTSTSTSFADPAAGDASCTFNETTNLNFGTVTSMLISGNKGPGITFTPKQTGRFRVCATLGGKNDTGASASSYSLTDGTTSMASTAINSTSTEPLTLCGELNATSTSAVTVKLQMGATAASTNTLSAAGILANAINWTINPLSTVNPMPYPVYFNSVTSSSTGNERHEWLSINTVCSSSPCTISDKSGDWVTSVTRTALGVYQLNIKSGMFSVAPVCHCTGGSTAARLCSVDASQGSKTSTFVPFMMNSLSSAQDGTIDISCYGHK